MLTPVSSIDPSSEKARRRAMGALALAPPALLKARYAALAEAVPASVSNPSAKNHFFMMKTRTNDNENY